MSEITTTPRDELSRKLTQAVQLARHITSVQHPIVLRDILSDLLCDIEELWFAVDDSEEGSANV
jgi:hypothetical protein